MVKAWAKAAVAGAALMMGAPVWGNQDATGGIPVPGDERIFLEADGWRYSTLDFGSCIFSYEVQEDGVAAHRLEFMTHYDMDLFTIRIKSNSSRMASSTTFNILLLKDDKSEFRWTMSAPLFRREQNPNSAGSSEHFYRDSFAEFDLADTIGVADKSHYMFFVPIPSDFRQRIDACIKAAQDRRASRRS